MITKEASQKVNRGIINVGWPIFGRISLLFIDKIVVGGVYILIGVKCHGKAEISKVEFRFLVYDERNLYSFTLVQKCS